MSDLSVTNLLIFYQTILFKENSISLQSIVIFI